MSKTSKTEYKNRENDTRKGKIRYQERVLEEQIAEQEIEEYIVRQQVNYEDFFDEVKNKLT